MEEPKWRATLPYYRKNKQISDTSRIDIACSVRHRTASKIRNLINTNPSLILFRF